MPLIDVPDAGIEGAGTTWRGAIAAAMARAKAGDADRIVIAAFADLQREQADEAARQSSATGTVRAGP
jgi:hypothetical protein